jgi:tetratricopeptide (TPR) repeat protein
LATLEPLRNAEGATLPLARALSTIGRESGNTQLYQEAIALYRRVLQQTRNPSPGFIIEVADVFSESPTSQAEALQLYQQLAVRQPDNLSLRVKRSVLERQLGQISDGQLQQELQTVLQTAGEIERQAIAQSLLRLDPPIPELLPIYQDLLNANADVPFLNFRVAQILIQQGDYPAARTALSAYSATPSGAQDLSVELLLADIERREGNLEASARRYETLIAQTPQDQILAPALRSLAGIRLAQNRPAEALEFYDQLLARNPDDLQTQLGRASLAYQTEQLSQSEAEAVLERWLAARPATDTPPELFSLVGALPPNPQREQLYETLLTASADDIGVNRRLVQVLALRDPERAQSRIDQILSRNPDDVNGYFLQGELAQVLGNLELASQAYRNVLSRQPENTDALAALGGIRFQQQRHTEATMLYARVLALKPNDWETRRILAELSVAQDRPMAALQQLRRLQQERQVAGNPDTDLDDRIEQIQLELMRRRGFQPVWERY